MRFVFLFLVLTFATLVLPASHASAAVFTNYNFDISKNTGNSHTSLWDSSVLSDFFNSLNRFGLFARDNPDDRLFGIKHRHRFHPGCHNGNGCDPNGNNSAPVPEPATMALLAAGSCGIAWMRRRKMLKLS